MAVLPISGGKYYSEVDDEDFEYLSQWKWRIVSGYGARNERYTDSSGKRRRRTLHLHRVINETPDGFFTDHVNGNKLDNRKCNLRTVTPKQNQQNKKTSSHSTSGYKGVGWCKQTKKWRVSLFAEGKFLNLGRFSCIKKAIEVYNSAALKYHGEFARLNKEL